MTDVIDIKNYKENKKEKIKKIKEDKQKKVTLILEEDDILSCREAVINIFENLNRAATAMTVKGDKVLVMATMINLADKRKVANGAYLPFLGDEIPDSLRDEINKLSKEYDEKIIQILEKEMKI